MEVMTQKKCRQGREAWPPAGIEPGTTHAQLHIQGVSSPGFDTSWWPILLSLPTFLPSRDFHGLDIDTADSSILHMNCTWSGVILHTRMGTMAKLACFG